MQGDLLYSLQHTWQAVLTWLAQHETLLIFLAILLEESGVPMPIPADIAMALAGYRVAQGEMSLLQAFMIGQTATLIGSSILYWAGYRGGRPLLFRYGKLLHLSSHRIAQVERMVIKMGPLAVIIGRLIPGLRLAAPLACGIFRIPYRLFVPAMIVGSSLYIGLFIVIGMWGGPALLGGLRLHGMLPLRILVTTALLVMATVLLRQLSRRARGVVPPSYGPVSLRRRPLQGAVLAGLGASAIMTLVVVWLLSLLALIGQSMSEQVLLQFLSRSSTTFPEIPGGLGSQRLALAGLIAIGPVLVVSHVLWAIMYAYVFEPRLRGSAGVRGLQFAALLWVFSGVVIFPALGAGLLGMELGAGLLPMMGEFVRYTVFGAALGTLYRLVQLARQPRLHEGQHHPHRRPRAPSATPATH